MSDINEEQKRLYKRAEENDIKIIEPSEEECFVGIIKEYQRKVDELQDRINKAISYMQNYINVEDSMMCESAREEFNEIINILKGDNK